MRVFQPLRQAPTALLWGGLSLSALGDQLYAVALAWVAVGVLGRQAGYLSALQAGVVLLAVLGIGRWADRWDPRRSMIAADLVRAAILAAVVAAWLLMGRPHAAGLVAAVVVLALGQAVFQPALQAVLPGVVADPRLLPAANGLLDATERSARLLGPGLVGLVAGIVPVVHFLTLDALSFLASALALRLIGRWRPASVPRLTTREPLWHGIFRGLRAVRSHRLLGFTLSVSALVNGGWFATYFLAVPLLIERNGLTGPGGGGLGAFGLVISAYGCTNLAGTLVLGGRTLPKRPQFLMFGGTALTGAGMVLLGLAGLLPAAWQLVGLAAGAAVSAVGGPMSDIPVAVLRQTRLLPGDRAAAMRASMAMGNSGTLVAMLAAPSVIARVGVVPFIVCCGGLLLGLGALGLLRHWRWVEPTVGEPARTLP